MPTARTGQKRGEEQKVPGLRSEVGIIRKGEEKEGAAMGQVDGKYMDTWAMDGIGRSQAEEGK